VLRCRPLADVAEHFFTDGSLELRERTEEWNAVAAFAGVRPANLLLLRQVHGVAVVVADASRTTEWTRPDADAVVSDDPTSALVVRVADCAPILLADRRQRIVAAVHAGWRSTMQRIACAAVESMRRHFGSDPSDLLVAMGPSLGVCCGEMGEEVVEAFRAAGHSEASIERWFERAEGRRPHFDLWRANRDQLAEAGVPVSQTFSADLCTRTHADRFHSYRAQGQHAGRMAAVIRPAN
jgi:YfiH family protein